MLHAQQLPEKDMVPLTKGAWAVLTGECVGLRSVWDSVFLNIEDNAWSVLCGCDVCHGKRWTEHGIPLAALTQPLHDRIYTSPACPGHKLSTQRVCELRQGLQEQYLRLLWAEGFVGGLGGFARGSLCSLGTA